MGDGRAAASHCRSRDKHQSGSSLATTICQSSSRLSEGMKNKYIHKEIPLDMHVQTNVVVWLVQKRTSSKSHQGKAGEQDFTSNTNINKSL